MGNETRATMIEGAIQLLATRGVHGASLLKVLEHTGAPRGSVYYHFPGGKEELILAALDLTGQRHDRFVDRFRGTSAEEITAGYLELWRRILVRSRLESGVQSSPSPSRYQPVHCWTVPGRSSAPLNGTSSNSTRRSAFSVPLRTAS
jgi:AcrR family transcriptional regulator